MVKNIIPIYEWRWEDEPDFMLPHAAHIIIERVWLNPDNGLVDERNELCIIVVRHPYDEDASSRAYAELRADTICDSMNEMEVRCERDPRRPRRY